VAQAERASAAGQRLHALDALRGVLALVVAASHVVKAHLGRDALALPASVAVVLFFVMSAYVLALAYDGRYLPFLVRRFVRLWPVYAACIVVGHALRGGLPSLAEALMWPGAIALGPGMVDPPAWTLYIEVAVTPLLPLLFWIVRRGRVAALAMVVAGVALAALDVRLFFLAFFAVGAAGAAFPLRWPQRMPAPLLWLGRISYSLYLSHAVVLSAAMLLLGRSGIAPGALAMLPVAWLLWRFVERPSIAWSRVAGAWPLWPVRA
jgi:peptidoglycan/LPS O-acetylase OafA/YrhL